MAGLVVWFLLKLLFLYLAAFLASISFFFYLNGKILPPHRTLQFPLTWRDSSSKAVVLLEKSQRQGGNCYIGASDSILEARRIYSNIPYDISILLKYPDRPEIPDLGNLRITLKLFRRDGHEAGNFEIIRALRYESKLLRFCRDLLGLPVAIWKDAGSERIERISLIERLIDAQGETERKANADAGGRPGNDFKFITSEAKDKEENFKKENPIDRVEISISPLPPLHSAQLEVLANLSPLQHFLFYWRVSAAILIIGISTSILWLLISVYALIESVKILLQISQGRDDAAVDLSEIEEMTEILQEVYNPQDMHSGHRSSGHDSDSESNNSSNSSSNFVSVQFLPPEEVAHFIGDLRQRRKPEESNTEDEDQISVYSSADEIEDQSVPNEKEA